MSLDGLIHKGFEKLKDEKKSNLMEFTRKKALALKRLSQISSHTFSLS
jgi:hypothetical protein